ncbi:MAG: Rne/Rng family ribonuclease [Candidatus Rokuibacteriota bacterium]|nr:MAG: Rne/Rng family ribonuclease [Candidatus Rokubacteria bacterium]
MAKRIVVNAGVIETRVALQENNLLTALYVERHRRRSIVGNVCKGIVTNVLPGMQAAFVDIGLSKDAFLYGGDYTANVGEYERLMLAGADEDPADLDVDDVAPKRESAPPIQDVLRKGQEVLVQVSKESLGTKGARVTSFISLPGRYLVYMPHAHHVGVSRRIHDEQERERLRAIVRGLDPPPGGFIVRTNAEGEGGEELASDIQFLGRLWTQIQARYETAPAPSVIHEEADLAFRVVRDLFSPEVDEFVVDTREAYEKCVQYANSLVPALVGRVKLYEGKALIFEALGVEKEIEKALRRRVWLKSGGYIVIDHTEALVSIDVNTGKYVGKRDFEQTVLNINLEAVGEIVRQIRLRDLGGIIIIDFIDMEREEHRQQVYKALRRALAEDKARTNVLEISELGLVEMTRKRVRQDLRSLFAVQCPTCKGSGTVKSDVTLAAEVFRKVRAVAAEGGGQDLLVRAHPDLVRHCEAEGREALDRLQSLLGRKILVQAGSPSIGREEYEVVLR